MSRVKKLRERYHGTTAERYEARRDNRQWHEEHEAMRMFLDDLRPDTVLDVPCGTGRFWPLYEERGIAATGLDISEDMMQQARERGWEDVQHGDVLSLDLPDDSFDVAVCVRLLNWMTQTEARRALAELRRVSRGPVIISASIGTGNNGRTLAHPGSVFGRIERERVVRRSPTWRYSMAVLG